MVKRLQKNKVCNRELDNTEECVNWQPYNKISKLITNNKGLGVGGEVDINISSHLGITMSVRTF